MSYGQFNHNGAYYSICTERERERESSVLLQHAAQHPKEDWKSFFLSQIPYFFWIILIKYGYTFCTIFHWSIRIYYLLFRDSTKPFTPNHHHQMDHSGIITVGMGKYHGWERACVWEHRHGWLGRSGDDDKIHIRHIIHVRRRPTSTHHDHMNTWTHCS